MSLRSKNTSLRSNCMSLQTKCTSLRSNRGTTSMDVTCTSIELHVTSNEVHVASIEASITSKDVTVTSLRHRTKFVDRPHDPGADNVLYFPEVSDVRRRIGREDDEVGVFPFLDGSNARVESHGTGGDQRG